MLRNSMKKNKVSCQKKQKQNKTKKKKKKKKKRLLDGMICWRYFSYDVKLFKLIKLFLVVLVSICIYRMKLKEKIVIGKEIIFMK